MYEVLNARVQYQCRTTVVDIPCSSTHTLHVTLRCTAASILLCCVERSLPTTITAEWAMLHCAVVQVVQDSSYRSLISGITGLDGFNFQFQFSPVTKQ